MIIRARHPENSDLKVTKLGIIDRVLVCSPSYYQKHLPPRSPNDLKTWLWLKLKQLPNKRTFLFGSGSQEVEFTSQIIINSVEVIYQYCLQGNGLAVLTRSQVTTEIKKGKLVPVLPNWRVEPLPLYALWPNNLKEGSVAKLLLSSLKGSSHY